MRFVHSLDDNVLAHVAGLLTGVVAGLTAIVTGHAVFVGHPPPESAPEPTAAISWVTDSEADTYGQSNDSDTGVVVALPAPKPGSTGADTPLCDRVLVKEGEVDTMNDQIEQVLHTVREKHQRRR